MGRCSISARASGVRRTRASLFSKEAEIMTMLVYYIDLALRSLRRNAVLTALTVVAVAVGIGTSMTVFTVFRALSADPIPEKSAQLFTVLIDNWGPNAPVTENLRT